MVSSTRQLRPRALALIVAAALAGCTTLPPSPSPRPAPSTGSTVPPPSPGSETPTEREASRAPSGTNASIALLEQSRTERANGSYGAAASSLERALRIEPTNPILWLELARVRLAEGDPDQAHALAQKALSLATGDTAIERQAREIMAQAR